MQERNEDLQAKAPNPGVVDANRINLCFQRQARSRADGLLACSHASVENRNRTYLLTARPAQDGIVCWVLVIGGYDWYCFPWGEAVGVGELRALNPLCVFVRVRWF